MFGGYSSPSGAVFNADDRDGLGSVAVNDAAAKIDDPQKWIEESAEFARNAYAPPVSLGRNAEVSLRQRLRDERP